MKLEFSRQISEKYLSIKFHGNLSSGSRVVPCGRKERQTEIHNEANIVAFRNAPKEKKASVLSSSTLMREPHVWPQSELHKYEDSWVNQFAVNYHWYLVDDEQRNILHEIRKLKANWIGHILRRNCLLQQVIEGKIKGQIEVTRRRWRRRKKLLGDLKDRRGYCQLKEEALDRPLCRNRLGRGFGPVVWQITDDDDDDDDDCAVRARRNTVLFRN